MSLNVEGKLTTNKEIVHNGGMAENSVDQNLSPRFNRRLGIAAAVVGVTGVVAAVKALVSRPSAELTPAEEPKDPLTKWAVQKRVIPRGGGIIDLANQVYGVQPIDTNLLMDKIRRASGLLSYQEEQPGVEIVIPNLDTNIDTVGLSVGRGYVPGLRWELKEVDKSQPRFRFAGIDKWYKDGEIFDSRTGQKFRFTILRDNSETGLSGFRVSVETVLNPAKK